MKLSFGINCDLMVYSWHSINLVPAISIFDIASDHKVDPITGCRGWDGKVVGRAIEITFFGIIINFMYPTNKFRKQFHTNLHGPLWSIKRKKWYYAPEY